MVMHIRNTSLVLILTISIFSIIFSQDKDPSALRLRLQLEKKTFLVDEPIYYEVVEENISDRVISTSPMYPSLMIFFKVFLIKSNGDTLPYKGGLGFPIIDKNRPGKLLNPGEKLYDVRDLLGIFGNQDDAHGITYYLPPDKYRVKVIHNTNYHAPIEWNEAHTVTKGDPIAAESLIDRMTIESNEVQFKVVEPEGIEKVVHTKLVHLYRVREPVRGREPVEIIPLLNEIVEQYPESVYAKAAYQRMRGFLDPEAKQQTLWNRDVILSKYSDSFFIYSIIELLNFTDKENELHSLSSKYPNTKIHEYSEHQIIKLSKRKAK